MAIQWFPGHMTSARRKAAETMEFTDVIIEVLDARRGHMTGKPLYCHVNLYKFIIASYRPLGDIPARIVCVLLPSAKCLLKPLASSRFSDCLHEPFV